ncbi:sporulation-control protein [Actinomadura pelletieri DSM 43383]|uniref:Sporulation-control protein n=1 Tax=Actinomadura pelletieri DSM 43383 TaxID=1120940 RepID=A0A495QIA2_9ACTN|nr:sporulation protein [Actinomadura pelletieri]RKS71859.1 sporulation-control protein [Actinomadura pelletieri DSM 43383]
MAFRTFLSSFGINAPEVTTVLGSHEVRPGGTLNARVTVRGGAADVRVERIAVQLVTRVEAAEPTEKSWDNPGVVALQAVPAFDLAAGEEREHRLAIEVPWEMPVTHALGRNLRGTRAAVRTILEIDNAVDRGDFDEIAVHALPAQDLFVDAYQTLGFRFDEAEVKTGRVNGGHNQLSKFWQELEFFFPADYGRGPNAQLETVFIARHDSLDLITGPHGPYPFDYAGLTLDQCVTWLDRHCRALWG